MKRFQEYFNFIDIIFFVLLILAEGWARQNFPAQLHTDVSLPAERVTAQGFVALLLGGITGLIGFFVRPDVQAEHSESLLSLASMAIRGIGTFIMAAIVAITAGLVVIILIIGFLPDDGNWVVLVWLLFALGILAAPFILTRLYYKRKEKLRPVHPSLRYLLFLPAIFLTTAMMNANALDIAGEYDWTTFSGIGQGVVYQLINFSILFAAPRLSATGQSINMQSTVSWAVGTALYFTGINLGH